MKFVQDDNFNEYVEKYKNLPLKEKKELVEKEMEELLVVLNALNEKFGDTPEVDFVEAMFVYSYSIKELIASLVNGLEK